MSNKDKAVAILFNMRGEIAATLLDAFLLGYLCKVAPLNIYDDDVIFVFHS